MPSNLRFVLLFAADNDSIGAVAVVELAVCSPLALAGRVVIIWQLAEMGEGRSGNGSGAKSVRNIGRNGCWIAPAADGGIPGGGRGLTNQQRSEERRVGKECRN